MITKTISFIFQMFDFDPVDLRHQWFRIDRRHSNSCTGPRPHVCFHFPYILCAVSRAAVMIVRKRTRLSCRPAVDDLAHLR